MAASTIWILCDFGEGEEYLFCEECGYEALHHHGLELDYNTIKKVSQDDLSIDGQCSYCSIGKE